jgi:hypothetical protein
VGLQVQLRAVTEWQRLLGLAKYPQVCCNRGSGQTLNQTTKPCCYQWCLAPAAERHSSRLSCFKQVSDSRELQHATSRLPLLP